MVARGQHQAAMHPTAFVTIQPSEARFTAESWRTQHGLRPQPKQISRRDAEHDHTQDCLTQRRQGAKDGNKKTLFLCALAPLRATLPMSQFLLPSASQRLCESICPFRSVEISSIGVHPCSIPAVGRSVTYFLEGQRIRGVEYSTYGYGLSARITATMPISPSATNHHGQPDNAVLEKTT